MSRAEEFSGFALKRLRLVSLNFDSPDTFPGSANRSYRIDTASLDFDLNPDRNQCTVCVAITASAKVKEGRAFTVSAKVEGLFEGRQEGLALRDFARINAPAILFPYIREIVSNVTARSGHPVVLLPTINFVQLAQLYAESDDDGSREITSEFDIHDFKEE